MADETTGAVAEPEFADAEPEAPPFDMTAAVEEIGHDLFPGKPAEESDDLEELVNEPVEAPEPVVSATPAPKSWAKETHEQWAKLPAETQAYVIKREQDMANGIQQYRQEAEYGKSLRSVLAPYETLLQQKGLDAPRAVADLMTAYTKLTQGTIEQRKFALQQLATNFGLADGASVQPMDTHYAQVMNEVEQLKAERLAEKQSLQQQTLAKFEQEITTFASDPAHPYFDAVLDEIEPFLAKGLSLQDAYDKAVWANPTTRQQELAKAQTEQEAKLKERARLDALPKQKAKGVNVRNTETPRSPTESLGSMDDTMRQILKDRKNR